jgi:aryl-alcohol dehydrogenase-like predicted oxidoreductase
MKLGLGTAQFGLDYGISNTEGKTSREQVAEIFRFAKTQDICIVDTATVYGDSETVIGATIGSDPFFKIITKLPHFEATEQPQKKVQEYIHSSLINLRRQGIYGYLFHAVSNLLSPQGTLIFNELKTLKETGVIEKIGVSVYTGEEVDAVLSSFAVDLIQVPINVFDQRLIASGHLHKLKSLGIEIHARSIFLQGLLLMPLEALPSYFNPIKPKLLAYHQFLAGNELTPVQGALAFIQSCGEIDVAILGVNTVANLQDNTTDYERVKATNLDFSGFQVNDPAYVNPSEWPKERK